MRDTDVSCPDVLQHVGEARLAYFTGRLEFQLVNPTLAADSSVQLCRGPG
jgi:hypothetical protein